MSQILEEQMNFCFVSLFCSRNTIHVFHQGFAKPHPGRARGPWPTWGRGVRLVRQAFDVGLELLVLFFQEKRTLFIETPKESLKLRKTLSLPPQTNRIMPYVRTTHRNQ